MASRFRAMAKVVYSHSTLEESPATRGVSTSIHPFEELLQNGPLSRLAVCRGGWFVEEAACEKTKL